MRKGRLSTWQLAWYAFVPIVSLVLPIAIAATSGKSIVPVEDESASTPQRSFGGLAD